MSNNNNKRRNKREARRGDDGVEHIGSVPEDFLFSDNSNFFANKKKKKSNQPQTILLSQLTQNSGLSAEFHDNTRTAHNTTTLSQTERHSCTLTATHGPATSLQATDAPAIKWGRKAGSKNQGKGAQAIPKLNNSMSLVSVHERGLMKLGQKNPKAKTKPPSNGFSTVGGSKAATKHKKGNCPGCKIVSGNQQCTSKMCKNCCTEHGTVVCRPHGNLRGEKTAKTLGATSHKKSKRAEKTAKTLGATSHKKSKKGRWKRVLQQAIVEKKDICVVRCARPNVVCSNEALAFRNKKNKFELYCDCGKHTHWTQVGGVLSRETIEKNFFKILEKIDSMNGNESLIDVITKYTS